MDDVEYSRKMMEVKTRDEELRITIENEKKRIFTEEIENQKRDKEKFNEIENNLKKADDENHRKKLEHDRKVLLDNMERKKMQMQEYLQKLSSQLVDNEAKRTKEALDAKLPHDTTLPIPEKKHKLYNCKQCQQKYPLKMMNKPKKKVE